MSDLQFQLLEEDPGGSNGEAQAESQGQPETAGAVHYAPSRSRALTRYRDDNSAAERALRALAL